MAQQPDKSTAALSDVLSLTHSLYMVVYSMAVEPTHVGARNKLPSLEMRPELLIA